MLVEAIISDFENFSTLFWLRATGQSFDKPKLIGFLCCF